MYLLNANALHLPLADNTVQACITSPPYWGLRDYGTAKQLGLEPVPDCLGWATGQPCGVCYVCHMVAVFREVRRVLRPDGTLWLNLGDSYNGSGGAGGDYGAGGLKEGQPRYPGRRVASLKPKDLVGIPWRVALALQADGWYLRSDVIWHKPNPMPESVTDRPTKAHEYFFLLSKSEQYYYDAEAVKEKAVGEREKFMGHSQKGADSPRKDNGRKDSTVVTDRNRRSVWTVATRPYKGSHFATFPPALVEVPVLASTSPKACPHCRAPWARVINKHVEPHPNRWSKTNDAMQFNAEENTYKNGGNLGVAVVSETTGWQPTCACAENDGSGKCLVLDPFSGTATVGRVCLEKGRAYVGTELNPAYLELAKQRTSAVQVELL